MVSLPDQLYNGKVFLARCTDFGTVKALIKAPLKIIMIRKGALKAFGAKKITSDPYGRLV